MAIVVFGVGQLVLPSIATSVARNRLEKYGTVESVSVSAFPAIELVFGDAGTVNAHLASFHAPTSAMARELSQAAGVSNLNISIDRLSSGLFSATDVHLTKRGRRLVGTGQLSEASLRQSFPFLESVTPVSSAGHALTLRGTGSALGVTATVDVTVGPTDGAVVASAGGLLGSLLHFTVWSDPRVEVTAVSGQATPTGMNLRATARMR